MHNPLRNTTSQTATEASRHLSDKVLQSAHDALASTRDYAHHALDSADSQVRHLRDQIDPAIQEFANSAQRLARRGADMAAHTGARAQESLQRYAAVTERYVADQPVKAVLIAAAAGALLAAMLLSARKRRAENQHRSY